MKTAIPWACLALLTSLTTNLIAENTPRLVMVAPFDNLSGKHQYIDYEIDTGAVTNNARRQYHVDRYSHAPRELLEHIITATPGLVPVERVQFDRVMLEVSGSIRDGLVDPEKAQRIAIKLGADAIVMGTILDLQQTIQEYHGYTHIVEHFYTAKIRVRVIDLTKDKGSTKIVPAIPVSFIRSGQAVTSRTPYITSGNADPYFTAISDAFEKLGNDEEFIATVGQRPRGLSRSGNDVLVTFGVTPKQASVFLKETDKAWRYIGATPLQEPLPKGIEFGVRFEKDGFAPWETIIQATDGLRVVRPLTAIPTSTDN